MCVEVCNARLQSLLQGHRPSSRPRRIEITHNRRIKIGIQVRRYVSSTSQAAFGVAGSGPRAPASSLRPESISPLQASCHCEVESIRPATCDGCFIRHSAMCARGEPSIVPSSCGLTHSWRLRSCAQFSACLRHSGMRGICALSEASRSHPGTSSPRHEFTSRGIARRILISTLH